MKVSTASKNDLRIVLSWLKDEYNKNSGGFWCNKNFIERCYTEKQLFVVKIREFPAAFQAGKYLDSIICVKENFQKKGIGTLLFRQTIKRAYRNKVNLLEGECSPQKSVNFWTKLGCSEYDGHSMFVNPHVRFIVERKFKFSKSLNRVNVSIEFLQADGLYEKNNFYLCQKFDIKGAIQPNGDIFLEKRVIGFKQNGLFSRVDLAVKIIVENKILCFCKVKDDEAIKCGVQRSKFDSSYFIDVLKT